ncbi:hypothetical protein [Clostridium sp.]|uniref:lipopolysaccharide biosynthesis protein n=1 Tax=Clostridium sp. TaxID=1506 RepID=UPI0032169CB0
MKKKIFYDMILNLISSCLSIFMLQYIFMPIVSRKIGPIDYGQILTVIGIINILVGAIGGMLNNVRLLQDYKYREKMYIGDFNRLIINWSVLGIAIIVVIRTLNLWGFDYVHLVFLVCMFVIGVLRTYLIVSFRLTLQYYKVLIYNVILAIGYAIGIGVFYVTESFFISIIFAELVALIYVVSQTKLLKESFKKTPLYTETRNIYIQYSFSNILQNSVVYMDRMLIFPMLGSEYVSVYYAAALFGKFISMGIEPINGVVLSYLTQNKSDFIRKKIGMIISSTIVITILTYIISAYISPIFIKILYPNVYDEALKILSIVNFSSILYATSAILRPLIMKWCESKWQIIINGTHITVYLICAIVFTYLWGGIGFGLGVTIAHLYKFVLYIILCIKYVGKKEL